jgi:hypothetical protein
MSQPRAKPKEKQDKNRLNYGLVMLQVRGYRSAEERGNQEESGGSGEWNQKKQCAGDFQYGDEYQLVAIEAHRPEFRNNFGNVRQLGSRASEKHKPDHKYQDISPNPSLCVHCSITFLSRKPSMK